MTYYADRPTLFVSQYYWPELIGSGPYCADMAEAIARHGVRVKVFTCRPHYPGGVVPQAYQGGSQDSQTRGAVGIERVPPRMPQERGAAGRIRSDLSYLMKGLRALMRGRISRSDSVVSFCPSILTVFLGIVATRRHGHHLAVVHDIPSGLAAGLGMVNNRFMVKAMRWLEKTVLNRVGTVIVLSHNMRRHLEEMGVRTPIEVLPLWVDTQKIRPLERPEPDPLTVLYSGNFGKKQSLDQIIELAAKLKNSEAPISVILRGDGSEAKTLAEAVSRRGLDNVSFKPLVPAERLAEGLAEGSIHLVPQDGSAADFAVPSKLFPIMAAGRPLIATARRDSLLWKLMEESQAILCVPSGDIDALTQAVEGLAADPELRREIGLRGRAFVTANHDKATILERFHELLRRGVQQRIGHAGHAQPSSSDL